MVLEDLHWADATSLSLVPFLARALRREPVALLLTYRPDDETGSPVAGGPARRASPRRPRARARPGPAGAEEAEALLAEIMGVAPAPEVADELLRLSAGNPFALEELAAAALESGWIDAGLGSARWARGRSSSLDPRRVDPGARRPPGSGPSAS